MGEEMNTSRAECICSRFNVYLSWKAQVVSSYKPTMGCGRRSLSSILVAKLVANVQQYLLTRKGNHKVADTLLLAVGR